MHLPHFEYFAPGDEVELASMLAKHGNKARILAGGTDLLVQLKSPGLKPEYLIDLRKVTNLAKIEFNAQGDLSIGSAVKLEKVLAALAVKKNYRALYQAIETIGARQILTMGSLGGNICNASPAADTPPALVALGATVTIADESGERSIAFEDLIVGNRQTTLKAGESLKNIKVRRPVENSGSSYHHFRVRGGMDIAMVNAAIYVEADPSNKTIKDIKIVLGVVGPAPIRAREAEAMLLGQTPDADLLDRMMDVCLAAARPIDDFRASAEYRREMLKVMIQRAFEEAWAMALCQTGKEDM